MSKLTRISYNSGGWVRPTGEARKHEARGTYNYENGFGHEDWLFRSEWQLGRWRYAFIQGAAKWSQKHIRLPVDLTLYTIHPDGRRRYVANIYSVEHLADDQSQEALAAFRQNGWVDVMKSEVKQVNGNSNALGDPKWARHMLNVRFRAENVDFFPPDSFAKINDLWLTNRHRYLYYDLEPHNITSIERAIFGQRKSQRAIKIHSIFRKGSRAITYTPEHRKMQAKLMRELEAAFGPECVSLEQDFVDVTVNTPDEIILYEIKTDLEPRTVIRNAFGQILEYAFYPTRKHKLPVRLVIVGRTPMATADSCYMRILQDRCNFALEYKVIAL